MKKLNAVLAAVCVFAVVVFLYTVYNASQITPPKKENRTTTTIGNVIARKPVVTGSFYPDDKKQLETMVNGYLNDAKDLYITNIKGLVVPHAGYVYSGPVAAYGFKQLVGQRYKTVIVMGPSHHAYFRAISIPDVTHYETPLGLVELDLDKIKELRNEKLVVNVPEAEAKEHSVEVEVPFLQTVLGDFKLIPVVVGDVNPDELADVLMRYIDNQTLIVASSDLSHYYPYDDAKKLDKICMDAIPNLDFAGMEKCEACGKVPVMALMRIAKKMGWSGQLLDYRNSGDTAGDKSSVVGYSSIVFYDGLNETEKEFLLKLARDTLEGYLQTGQTPAVDESTLSPRLKKIQGCFVTLNKNGNLRGCIGHIFPQTSLYKCVTENAVSAAVHDPRFRPVTYDELKDIVIDISVLGYPEILEHEGAEDLIKKLTPMKDGVVITAGSHKSTYLPQVWEQLPDKEDFLTQLCIKGGSSGDCWQDSGTKVETYQAQVFEEA